MNHNFEHLIGTAYAVDVMQSTLTKRHGHCTCGWNGPDRWVYDVAVNDCQRHLKNTPLVRASESESA
jgi:hypothetical protein